MDERLTLLTDSRQELLRVLLVLTLVLLALSLVAAALPKDVWAVEDAFSGGSGSAATEDAGDEATWSTTTHAEALARESASSFDGSLAAASIAGWYTRAEDTWSTTIPAEAIARDSESSFDGARAALSVAGFYLPGEDARSTTTSYWDDVAWGSRFVDGYRERASVDGWDAVARSGRFVDGYREMSR